MQGLFDSAIGARRAVFAPLPIFFFSSRRRHTRSSTVRGLGDVYKRQALRYGWWAIALAAAGVAVYFQRQFADPTTRLIWDCLLYTSDAADERSSGDLGGRRILKKTTRVTGHWRSYVTCTSA